VERELNEYVSSQVILVFIPLDKTNNKKPFRLSKKRKRIDELIPAKSILSAEPNRKLDKAKNLQKPKAK
jgi:hypothetical protein